MYVCGVISSVPFLRCMSYWRGHRELVRDIGVRGGRLVWMPKPELREGSFYAQFINASLTTR